MLQRHPRLLTWFAQNCLFTFADADDDAREYDKQVYHVDAAAKIRQLPIGLDYHTIAGNPDKFWRDPSEGHLPLDQESILNQIRATGKPWSETCSHKLLHTTISK